MTKYLVSGFDDKNSKFNLDVEAINMREAAKKITEFPIFDGSDTDKKSGISNKTFWSSSSGMVFSVEEV